MYTHVCEAFSVFFSSLSAFVIACDNLKNSWRFDWLLLLYSADFKRNFSIFSPRIFARSRSCLWKKIKMFLNSIISQTMKLIAADSIAVIFACKSSTKLGLTETFVMRKKNYLAYLLGISYLVEYCFSRAIYSSSRFFITLNQKIIFIYFISTIILLS